MSSTGPHYDRVVQRHDEELFSHHKQPHSMVEPMKNHSFSQDTTFRTQHSRSLFALIREWKWESTTWLIGTCALASVVVLLVVYQDRSLEDWTVDINLATVVATLSQITQSAIMVSVSSCIGQLKWDWLRSKRSASDLGKFDDASRGPQGSLMLLPRTKLHLVSLGALATILMLAFAPFMQQSNTIRVRTIPIHSLGSASDAAVSRSVYYYNGLWDSYLMPSPSYATPLFSTSIYGQSNFHPHMHRAIVAGLLDESMSMSDVKGNCSAEACRWEEYATLSVCASIEDVSSSIEVFEGTNGYANTRISGASWIVPSQNISIADTFWMAAPYRDLNFTAGKLPSIADVFIAYYPPCNEMKQTSSDDQRREGVQNASNWKAHKGTLTLCLQTLESTYNTTMETKAVETISDLEWKITGPGLEGHICLAQPYKGETFCVGKEDWAQWTSSLGKAIEGAASIVNGGDNYYTGQWVPEVVQDILGPTPASCDPDLDSTYGSAGFARRINNLAVSMSNALRTGNTTSPDSIVRGTEWLNEQYFFVDFKWLALPAAIWLGITVFILATMVKSRDAETPLWKSSSLALYHVADRNNGMQSLGHLEKESSKMQMQLQYNGESWYLQDVTGRPT